MKAFVSGTIFGDMGLTICRIETVKCVFSVVLIRNQAYLQVVFNFAVAVINALVLFESAQWGLLAIRNRFVSMW